MNVHPYSKVVLSFMTFINGLKRSVVITDWAVALTMLSSHSAKHKKKADFYPKGAKTPKPILMKLGMVDYVRDPTPHDNFGVGGSTWVVWAYRFVFINRK